MSLLFEQVYNPDILNCLANLSNDEVFTPPEVVNKMLDMLPQDLFKSPDTTFLDPACKTGVFLREIAKRLLEGLKDAIPDEDERRKHIFTKQLFGIAITEMTSLLSRRSLYCSKYANTIYSIVPFDTVEGNIRFKNAEHYWEGSKCGFCGANKAQYDRDKELEQHAYEFIHTSKPEEIWNMRFDVIIGNPPYQLSDGGDNKEGARNRGGAIPIYQRFVESAKMLKPRYMTMIIPARWFAGGRGLDEFRSNMLADKRVAKIVDYPVSSECFPGVEIKGGVCYFLWAQGHNDDCCVCTVRSGNESTMVRPLLESGSDVFLRYNESISVFRKVQSVKDESFSDVVSTQKPFGLRTFVHGSSTRSGTDVELFTNQGVTYIKKDMVVANRQWIDAHKILISMAYGAGEDFPHQIINRPFYAGPGSCCTETYLVVGPFKTEEIAKNVIEYMKTKFFRFLVMLRKNTQHGSKSVYQFVPMQDFSKPWTDAELYAKYGLTDDEVAFIESMIRPMD